VLTVSHLKQQARDLQFFEKVGGLMAKELINCFGYKELSMPDSIKTNSVKERVTADLQKAKAEGQLRSERIREIVREAVEGAISEFREGSGEIRSVVRDAVAAVIESLRERGKDSQEDITASIEAAIDGVTHKKRQAIAKTQAEVQQLQSSVDREERALQEQIDATLTDLATVEKDASSNLRDTVASAINNVRDSEEVSLMRKRYAQLQTQLAILKANLTARYGDRYDDVRQYLDDAKVWYQEAQQRAAAHADDGPSWVEEKQSEVERKMTEAGGALARKERQARQLLKELWLSFRDSKN
jgi:hypothetical protein